MGQIPQRFQNPSVSNPNDIGNYLYNMTSDINAVFNSIDEGLNAKIVGASFDIDGSANVELDFSDAVTKYTENYTQTSNISFTLNADNSINEVGNAIYTKLIADGSALTFSSDFFETRNDYVDVAGTFDLWFTLLPDLKVQYSIIERT